METEFHVKSDDKKTKYTENIQELYYENQELKIVNKKVLLLHRKYKIVIVNYYWIYQELNNELWYTMALKTDPT